MIELYVQKYPFINRENDAGHDVAYSLLECLCNEKLGTYPGKVEKDENGKPHFSENINGVKYHFSISHSNGYAAVLFTDLCECGVDIEPQMTKERAEKINDRFLSDDFKADEYDGVILTKLIGFDNNVNLSFDFDSNKKEKSATEKWTTLEALLKTDGRGFGAFKARRELAGRMRTRTFKLIDGDKNVYVTVSLEK